MIDEARTPLIISGQSGKSTALYEACDVLAKQLERGEASGEFSKMNAIMGEEIEETGDFIVDEKEKTVNLTEDGVKKVEKFFHIENLADPENLEIQHNIILALRAHNLMFRDQDYVVTPDGEVMIVDEFTGRIMPGRRYSDGLHQAIEAKEHVKVRRESKTLATITFQNLFNKYDKKSGMTGTAITEEKEFRDISVSTGLIHSDALALAGNGTPVVTFHRERKKRSCTCLLISKVTYWYFLIFAVLQNMIHMDSCTLFSR